MAHSAAQKEADVLPSSDGSNGILTIDLAALQRNYDRLKAQVSPARLAAVVKADAYGLGAEQVSRALGSRGCQHFFVAQFTEAVRLQPALPHGAQVFVLNGLQPGAEFACAEKGIIPVINSLEQLHRWKDAAKAMKRQLPAVVQFDTGMSRLGVPFEERALIASLIGRDNSVNILFIMSHLASADEPEHSQNGDQYAEMILIANEFPRYGICFANSGGIFLGKTYHGALARSGIALYGGNPSPGLSNPMEPVVSIDVPVIQTRAVTRGARVGYSGAYVAPAAKRLAVIAAGYADGLLRSLSGSGAVYCDGVRLPIVGRVSMDSIIVDVTALPEGRLQLGSLVEVLGPHQSLEDLARDAGTISYEILTSLGNRYLRQYR